jgi:hypothetical protein
VNLKPHHPGANARIPIEDLAGLLRRHVHDGDPRECLGAGGTKNGDLSVGAKRHHASLMFPLGRLGAVLVPRTVPPQECDAVRLRGFCELSDLFVSDRGIHDRFPSCSRRTSSLAGRRISASCGDESLVGQGSGIAMIATSPLRHFDADRRGQMSAALRCQLEAGEK